MAVYDEYGGATTFVPRELFEPGGYRQEQISNYPRGGSPNWGDLMAWRNPYPEPVERPQTSEWATWAQMALDPQSAYRTQRLAEIGFAPRVVATAMPIRSPTGTFSFPTPEPAPGTTAVPPGIDPVTGRPFSGHGWGVQLPSMGGPPGPPPRTPGERPVPGAGSVQGQQSRGGKTFYPGPGYVPRYENPYQTQSILDVIPSNLWPWLRAMVYSGMRGY